MNERLEGSEGMLLKMKGNEGLSACSKGVGQHQACRNTVMGMSSCSKGCNGIEHEETPAMGVSSCSKPVGTPNGASVICCNHN